MLAMKPRAHEQLEQAGAPGSCPCPATVPPESQEMRTPRTTASHPWPIAQHPSGHKGIFFLETLLQERSSKSPKTIPSCGHGSHKGLLLWLRHSPMGPRVEKPSHWSPKRPGFRCCLHSIPCSQERGVTQHQTLHSHLRVLANASTIPARL